MLFRSSEAMSKYVSGVILYDETIWQNAKDGTPLVKLIEQAGAIPGIKVDEGTQALPNCPGELVTVGLDKLAERLKKYYERGARFAKWRAVIDIGAAGIPTMTAISVNAHALARYAALCQAAQIVPIVEPEVLMDGDHDIDRCYDVTQRVLNKTFQELRVQRVELEGMVLKPNMAISGKKCAKQASVDEVAEKTVRHAEGLRAGGGARHCLPLRRAERRGSDRASQRHEPDRQSALEADLLLRPRAAGGAAEGVVRQGRERRRRPARLHPSRAHECAGEQG